MDDNTRRGAELESQHASQGAQSGRGFQPICMLFGEFSSQPHGLFVPGLMVQYVSDPCFSEAPSFLPPVRPKMHEIRDEQ
jgi:hypothetical protein